MNTAYMKKYAPGMLEKKKTKDKGESTPGFLPQIPRSPAKPSGDYAKLLKAANDAMKQIHMKLLDVEVRKTKLEKMKLSNNKSASDYNFDVFFGYRKSELQNMFRPSNEFILNTYTHFTARENSLNVFWDVKDLPNSSHKGEAIWKGLKKSKYYVCFLSELSLRPMKDDPFTGLDATEGQDDFLAEIEQAVNTFDLEHLIIVLMGRYSHFEPPEAETDIEEDTDGSQPASYLRYPPLDPTMYPLTCSTTCQARSVQQTMRLLFTHSKIIRCEPDGIQECVDEVQEHIKAIESHDPLATDKEVQAGLEDEVLGMLQEAAKRYAALGGNKNRYQEIEAIRGRILGDREMNKVEMLMKADDYKTCVKTIKEAGKYYAMLGEARVERSADELSQIMQSEDRERQSRTRAAGQLVKGWVERQGLDKEKQAVYYLSHDNLSKALGCALVAQRSFEYSNTPSNIASLITDIQGKMRRRAEAKRKQDEEDAKKPRANEVNLKFKQMVMDEPDSIRAIFDRYDDDHSGVLSMREFRMVLENINCPMTNLEFRKLYRRYDPDGDGISYDEFLHTMIF